MGSRSESNGADTAMTPTPIQVATDAVLDLEIAERDCCDELVETLRRLRGIREQQRVAADRLKRLTTDAAGGDSSHPFAEQASPPHRQT